jgi:cytochrome c-type biogenesis protein CcmH/NrfG
MTDYSWWPGLVVLAGGLAGGFFFARQLRSGGKKTEREQHERDLALKIQDLEGRRDDLYRRLREEGDSLTESDRRQLEQAAARTLRDLEEVTAKESKRARKGGGEKTGPDDEERETRVSRAPSGPARRPLLTGFLLGVGMVAIVAVLVYWAVRDTAGTGVVQAPMQDAPHPEAQLQTAEAQAEYEALRARVEGNPEDIGARKRLALLLLSNDQLVPAFQQAQALLDRDPRDIDGLYVQAVARIAMGQSDVALNLLDQVLELYPDHVQALGWRGIVFYRNGDISAAVSSWERGIEAAGGQQPELEQMVMAALEEEAGSTSTTTPVGPAPAPTFGVAALFEEVASDEFAIRLELASGVVAPDGVLFVALRSVAGSPPVAVRRFSAPTFPLDLTLTANDSMMGSELPDSGLLSVRLDQDGDVTAASAGDLIAEAEVEAGQMVTLTLSP